MLEPDVLRPHWRVYRRWFARGSIFLVPFVVLGLVISVATSGTSLPEALIGAGTLLGLYALTVALIGVWISTSSIELRAGEIVWRRWFVFTTRLPLGHGTTGLLGLWGSSTKAPVTKLRMRNGRHRISLNGGIWELEDMQRIAAHAGTGVVDDPTVSTVAQWEARVPGTTRWAERHPIALGVTIGLVIALGVPIAVFSVAIGGQYPPFDPQPPKAIPAAVQRDQDDLVTSALAVVEGEHAAPDVDVSECQNDEQYKGWDRRVTVDVTLAGADGLTPAQVDRLIALADDAGFDDADTTEDREYLYVTDDDSDRSLDVSWDAGVATVDSRTDCEVPAR